LHHVCRPPSVSPLSLHDALPISPARSRTPAATRRCSASWEAPRHDGVGFRLPRDLEVEYLVAMASNARLKKRAPRLMGRESPFRSEEPRLNSSHGSISYAVFCLK